MTVTSFQCVNRDIAVMSAAVPIYPKDICVNVDQVQSCCVKKMTFMHMVICFGMFDNKILLIVVADLVDKMADLGLHCDGLVQN